MGEEFSQEAKIHIARMQWIGMKKGDIIAEMELVYENSMSGETVEEQVQAALDNPVKVSFS